MMYCLVQFVLVLSQEHAAVERSFSVINDVLLLNMKSETVCAIKTVCDAIKFPDMKVHEYKAPDEMFKYGCQAIAKFSIQMNTVKSKKTRKAEKRKAAAIEDQNTEAKKKN